MVHGNVKINGARNRWNNKQWKIYYFAKVPPDSRIWNIPTWLIPLLYIACYKEVSHWSHCRVTKLTCADLNIIVPIWWKLITWVYNVKANKFQEIWVYFQEKWRNIPSEIIFKAVNHFSGSHTIKRIQCLPYSLPGF